MFWLFGGAILVADRLIKYLIDSNFTLHESKSLIGGLVSLFYVQNKGAAFSMLSGQRWLLLIIAAVVICGIIYYRFRYPLKRTIDMSLGCICGGALGNMIDRFFFGYVIDYISIGWWPVFNLADMAIVCGGVWLFINILFGGKNKSKLKEIKHETERNVG